MNERAQGGTVDLTPRPPHGRSVRSRWVPLALLALVGLSVVGLIWFLVANSQAFLEADIAVSEREGLGDKRFQLLGSPIADVNADDLVIVSGDEFTPFTVVFDAVLVDVVSQGTPPDLFDAGIPVVLEGHWVRGSPPEGISWQNGANDGWYFESDRILVKHDNDYRSDRIDDAEERGQLDASGD